MKSHCDVGRGGPLCRRSSSEASRLARFAKVTIFELNNGERGGSNGKIDNQPASNSEEHHGSTIVIAYGSSGKSISEFRLTHRPTRRLETQFHFDQVDKDASSKEAKAPMSNSLNPLHTSATSQPPSSPH
jgi:hypothetical protein